jgi:hypothetical protein
LFSLSLTPPAAVLISLSLLIAAAAGIVAAQLEPAQQAALRGVLADLGERERERVGRVWSLTAARRQRRV